MLLAAGEQDEEADPEQAHGVPIPTDAVDEDLAVLDVAEAEESGERDRQRNQSDGQVNGVRIGHDVEGVAAGAVGLERDAFELELAPADRLAGEEEATEHKRGHKPGHGSHEVGLPRPNHSSMASIWWNMRRRATSTVMELRSSAAVFSQKMGGTAVGSQR